MKIWYQSSGALKVDAIWGRYLEALKRNIQKVVRSDTTIHFYGVEVYIPEKDRFRSHEYLNNIQIVRNALRAEEQGYDAFIVGSTIDPGYQEIKEILQIPVAFIGETTMHIASMIGEKFSMIVNDLEAGQRIKNNMQSYGIERKAGPIEPLNHSAEEIAQKMEHPAQILEDFQKVAKNLIRQGADVLVPGCGVLNQLLIDMKLREMDGVPVLDVAGVTVKYAEMMVDLAKANRSVTKKVRLDTQKLKKAMDHINVVY